MLLCFPAYMRTTVDLPAEVIRQAKVTAIERGTTLRELIRNALAKELGLESRSGNGFRIAKPLFSSKSPGSLSMEEAKLAEIDAQEDARQDGLLR